MTRNKSFLKKILDKIIWKSFKPVYNHYFAPFIEQQRISSEYLISHNNLEEFTYLLKLQKFNFITGNKGVSDKITVLFIFQEASYWPSFKSLYELLKSDSRFNVFVVAIPTLQLPNLKEMILSQENIDFLNLNCIDYIDSRPFKNGARFFDPLVLHPDYTFFQLHYDYQRPFEYKTTVMSLYSKVCLIPHAFLLSEGDYSDLSNQRDFYRVFVPNKCHHDILSSVLHSDENIHITGYPRFDLYKMKSNSKCLWKMDNKTNSSIKRIIWSPHWWAYGHSQKYFDGLINIWDSLFDLLNTNPNIEIIIKPHPSLFKCVVACGYMSKEKLNEKMNAFTSLPNGSIYQGGNYIDLFKDADCIINNSISFIAEWLPSEKPMLFVESERNFSINNMAYNILSVYYKAYSPSDIIDFITDVVIKGEDPLKIQRLNLINDLSFVKELASENIKKFILNDSNFN